MAWRPLDFWTCPTRGLPSQLWSLFPSINAEYRRCIVGQYLIRRILQAIPLLFFISILMFLLIHSLPGGAEAVYDNPQLDAAGRAAIRESLGLNDPLPVPYVKWI